MTTYRTFTTTVITQVTSVRIYEETLAHVVENHPEIPATFINLPMTVGAVGNTLGAPTHVERSREDHYVFVDEKTTNRAGAPLRVPVKVVASTSALVKTFYFAPTPDASRVIWKRD